MLYQVKKNGSREGKGKGDVYSSKECGRGKEGAGAVFKIVRTPFRFASLRACSVIPRGISS